MVSDLFGTTGRRLIEQLCGESAHDFPEETITSLACGLLRAEAWELHQSSQSYFEVHHLFQLCRLLRVIIFLENDTRINSGRLHQLMERHEELLGRLTAVPGVGLEKTPDKPLISC
jgi:transposase